MSQLKLVSPLLDQMEVQRCLSDTSGAQVYLVKHTLTDREYVVKHISIPPSQTQVEALIFSGAVADAEAAQAYYQQVVEDYKQQLTALGHLSASSGIAAYLSCQVEKKEGETGFDLYLLADPYQSLAAYLAETPMTHLRVLNLGIDLCTALEELRASGLVHRDIKPENVFLNGLNSFMLGDLGVVTIDDLKYSSVPESMLSDYSAPEASDIMATLDQTIDLYSVGMILYRILNGNHGPFEDEKTSEKAAAKHRQNKEALPAPMYADYELAEIVLKACAPLPENRYQSPAELMQDLILYMKRNQVSDTLIVPPIVTDQEEALPPEALEYEPEPVAFTDAAQLDDQFVQNFSPDEQSAAAILKKPDAVHQESEEEIEEAPAAAEPPVPPQPPEAETAPAPESGGDPHPQAEAAAPAPSPAPQLPKKKPRKWPAVLLAAVLGVSILAAAYFVFFYHGSVTVEAVNILETGPNTVTVSLSLPQTDHSLNLVCTDAYGNQQTLAYAGEAVTFENLMPGAQYRISVAAEDGAKITGVSSAMASTTATAEIVSFSASSPAIGKVELNLVLSGAGPDHWTLSYHAEGGEEKSLNFSGLNVTVDNLEPGVTYYFKLQQPEDLVLTGETETQFTTGAAAEIQDLKIESLSATSVGIGWSCDAETPPESWEVTCTGTDGFADAVTVTDMQAQFTGLTAGVTYTLSVTSNRTATPGVISATPAETTITALSAQAADAGTVELSWQMQTPAPVMITYYVQDAPELSTVVSADAEQTALTVTQLIPGQEYHFRFLNADGNPLSGETEADVTMPAAEKFTSYGCGNVFMGMFLRPQAASWTVRDLSVSRKEYTKDESVAFAIEALTTLRSSTDTVLITYVVTDANGTPVDYYAGSGQWNSLWNNKLYVGELLRTPQEAGTYRLTIYFNNQRLTSHEFIVK